MATTSTIAELLPAVTRLQTRQEPLDNLSRCESPAGHLQSLNGDDRDHHRDSPARQPPSLEPVSRNALTSLNLKQSGVAPAAHEPDLPRTVELDSSAFRFVPKPLPLGRALLKLPSELGHLSDLLGATAYASGSFWQRRSHGQHGPTCDTAVSLIWSVRLALSDSQAFVACSKANRAVGLCITCRTRAARADT